MEDSILSSIKKMLGIPEDYDAFDTDVIIDINAAFFTLNQLGIGPEDGFAITGKNDVWSSFLGYESKFEAVKMYVYIKVRLVFDPPTSAFVLEAMKKQADELEWRLNAQAETA